MSPPAPNFGGGCACRLARARTVRGRLDHGVQDPNRGRRRRPFRYADGPGPGVHPGRARQLLPALKRRALSRACRRRTLSASPPPRSRERRRRSPARAGRWLARRTRAVLDRAALRVGRGVIEAAQPRVADRARAHRAGLQRHVEIAFRQAALAEALGGGADASISAWAVGSASRACGFRRWRSRRRRRRAPRRSALRRAARPRAPRRRRRSSGLGRACRLLAPARQGRGKLLGHRGRQIKKRR